MKKSECQRILDFFKNKNNIVIVIIFILGAFLMSAVSGNDEREVKQTITAHEQEEGLKEILSHIKGVGKVEVLVTYYGGAEQSIAYEIKSQQEEKSSEMDKRAVMSGSEPVIVQELYPEVKGVIVVAQGAGRIEIKRALTEAVCAALGVSAARVSVYEGAY